MARSIIETTPVWSEETYSLRNVVYNIGLPTVVKVSEGIYGDNEAESFSCGDLIKLDFQKSMTKVSAKFLDSDTFSELTVDQFGYHKSKDEILIPIQYKGRVQVIQKFEQEKQFHSVEELVKEFPKFVRVEKPLKVNIDKRCTWINVGSKLELDRVLPSKGLVCRLNGKDTVLNHKQIGLFTLVSDDNVYTLKEILEKLPLPQYVQFLDEEFKKLTTEDLDDVLGNFKKYSGCMKIQKVVKQNVIVGHHKTLKRCRKTHCERSIALFPLDSLAVSEILVHVPMYTETDDYQLILARNFSKQLYSDDIDGVIYLEFAKNSRVRLFNNNRFSPRNKPLPPLPKLPVPDLSKLRLDRHKITWYDEEYDDAITPPTPKLLEKMRKLKSRMKRQKSNYVNITQLKYNRDSQSDDETYIKPIECDTEKRHSYIEPLAWHSRPEYENMEPLASVFGARMSSSQKPMFTALLPSPTFTRNSKRYSAAGCSTFRSRRRMPLPPIPNNNERDHEEKFPKSSKIRHSKVRESSRQRKGSQSDDQKASSKKHMNRTISDSCYDKEQKPIRKSHRPVSFFDRDDSIPLATVKPQISRQSFREVNSIACLSVEKLVVNLKECGLSKLARLCDKEMLDGSFINGLSADELKDTPFCLLPVDLKKLELMKDGWKAKRMWSLPRAPKSKI